MGSGKNRELVRGVNAIGRGKVYKRKGLWNKTQLRSTKPIEKAEDKKVVKKAHVTEKKRKIKTAKLRKSIVPGTILILLAGRYQGKRVIFLKQLESGLLLVTGPFSINGVPLRRVDQAYVIATKTKIDNFKVEIGADINDAYFAKDKKGKKVKKEEEFFSEKKKEPEKDEKMPDSKKEKQKEIDNQIVALITDPIIKKYLDARFSLNNKCFPHQMEF